MTNPKLIKHLLFTPGTNQRWGLPGLLWGKPGVGKTSVVKQIAAECGLHCETITASIRAPEDFLGLPVPVQGTKGAAMSVDYAPPVWARRAAEATEGAVVFIDEVTTCAPAVQAALLRVVNEGMVGDFELPPSVRFLLAANPVELAAGGYDLAPPLANRFAHLDFDDPDLDAWTTWLLADAGDESHTAKPGTAKAMEDEVMKKWPVAFAKAKGNVTSFLKSRANMLMKMPNADDPNCAKAWPSPRSWELCTRAIAGAEVHDLEPVLVDELIMGFVGTGVASEYLAFAEENDLPDPAALLDGKKKWKHDPQRPDRTQAVLSACTALVTPRGADNRVERGKALWTIVADVASDATDVAIPAAKGLAKAGLAGDQHSLKSMAHLKPVMKAAGVL